MKEKNLINYYPFIELPDPKVRYLIRDSEFIPLAVLWFDDIGTPHLRYLRNIPHEFELPILTFVNDKQRLLFGY